MITKGELLKLADASIATIANHHEKTLDQMLRSHVAERGLIGHVDFSQRQGYLVPSNVMNELCRRYQEEGHEANIVRTDGADVIRIVLG